MLQPPMSPNRLCCACPRPIAETCVEIAEINFLLFRDAAFNADGDVNSTPPQTQHCFSSHAEPLPLFRFKTGKTQSDTSQEDLPKLLPQTNKFLNYLFKSSRLTAQKPCAVRGARRAPRTAQQLHEFVILILYSKLIKIIIYGKLIRGKL